jgi:hypothetical protein
VAPRSPGQYSDWQSGNGAFALRGASLRYRAKCCDPNAVTQVLLQGRLTEPNGVHQRADRQLSCRNQMAQISKRCSLASDLSKAAASAAFSARWENVAARNKVNNLNSNFAHEEAFLSATHG